MNRFSVLALPGQAAIRGLRLGRETLVALVSVAASRRLRDCAHCGRPVTEGDPFIRYRGDYYHAHGCVESHPPALTRRRARGRRAMPG
jgi:hypothetical protein